MPACRRFFTCLQAPAQQQADHHAHARCHADGRPGRLVHIVVGGMGSLAGPGEQRFLGIARASPRLATGGGTTAVAMVLYSF